MRDFDLTILGAGISGLSLAHYAAKRGLTVRVIESSDRIGGTLHTQPLSGADSDFWIELGAHTCYNSYGALIGIMEDLAVIDDLIPRDKLPFRMLIGNQLKSIPSRIRFIELLLSAPRLLFIKRQGESVESYYSRIVGKKNFETVFGPLFNAVPSQRANDFPADVLFKKRPRRKDMLRSFTLRHGLHSVTDRIAAQPGLDIEANDPAVQIEAVGDRYITVTKNGKHHESAYLAIATPAVEAASLLRSSSAELAGELAQIRVVNFESVGVVVRKDRLAMERVAGIVPGNDQFYSIVSRDIVADDNYRGFTFHFKADQLNQPARIQRIGEVLGISTDELVQVNVRKNVLPSFRADHRDRIRKIDNLLANQNLLLTGNYFLGMSIEDCVTRSRSEATRIEIGKPL